MSANQEAVGQALPSENVQRGTLLALLIVPAGIIAWVLLWSVGFIASIVAFGVAIGAMWLYRLGSGGRISRTGAIRITVITIVTLLLAFVAGMITDQLAAFTRAFQAGRFLEFFVINIQLNAGAYAIPFLMALGFGALGCFSILRNAFQQTRPEPAESVAENRASDDSR